MRVTSACSLAAFVLACSDDPQTLTWRARFESPDVAGRVRVVALSIRRGSCTAESHFADERGIGDAPTPRAVPPLGAGTWSFVASGRDASCVEVAADCVTVALPSDLSVVELVLRARAGAPAACAASTCVDGRCTARRDGAIAVGPDAAVDAAEPADTLVPSDRDPNEDALDAPDACGADGCDVAGACVVAGTLEGADPCVRCEPSLDRAAYSNVCVSSVADDSHADFVAGSFGRSAANLYATAAGAIETVNRSDLDDDGHPDLVVVNVSDSPDGYSVASAAYRGSAAGLSAAQPFVFTTVGALNAAVADFNADGAADVVFAQPIDASGAHVNGRLSFFYGVRGAGGTAPTLRMDVPLAAAADVAPADLNRDGWLDLVVPRNDMAGSSSVVLWGGATGFSATNALTLAATRGRTACIGDVDDDGSLDVALARFGSSGAWLDTSIIVRGGPGGPIPTSRLEYPTHGAVACSLADLDADGYLDVTFGENREADDDFEVGSTIYFGSPVGPTVARTEDIPTRAANHVAAFDVDMNGFLDLAISQYYGPGVVLAGESLLLLRGPGGTFETRTFPTEGGLGVALNDWNGDDHVDLAFGGSRGASPSRVDVHAGTGIGPMPGSPTMLSARGAAAFGRELGHTWDRSWEESFVSRAHDLGPGMRGPSVLEWATTALPAETRVRFQVRSAATEAGLAEAPWLGRASGSDFYEVSPAALSRAHAGHRFVQYRAHFYVPRATRSPVLDRVTIRHR